MDNQHKQIKGYRELSQEEINLMNEIKQQGELVSRLRDHKDIDQRWVSVGQTHLQQGVMALVRAVAQPTSF